MPRRVLCHVHEERTPSCVIYPTGWHCYGCGAHGQLKELGVSRQEAEKYAIEKEDIEESIKQIKNLPTKPIRGFELHYDYISYYLLYPNDSYYLRRFIEPKGPKYISPAGCPRPVFVARFASNPVLVIVEGEFNALSLAKHFPEFDVISPGSANQFDDRVFKFIRPNQELYLVLDQDPAGIQAGLKFYKEIVMRNPYCNFKVTNMDFNEMDMSYESPKFRKEVKRVLGLP